jgi:hypothetical protein
MGEALKSRSSFWKYIYINKKMKENEKIEKIKLYEWTVFTDINLHMGKKPTTLLVKTLSLYCN